MHFAFSFIDKRAYIRFLDSTRNSKVISFQGDKILVDMKILVIHGPNLNLLGMREPEIYGKTTLEEINSLIRKEAKALRVQVESFQSNSEGEIVSKIQDATKKYDGLIINPAAYTHTSVAIRDAISSTGIPTVEVHISNVYRREEFRQKSFISPVASGVISGFGVYSYILGLRGLIRHLKNKEK
jgi:3-dehydroquinate dehydratase-2